MIKCQSFSTNQILWNHEKTIGIINCPKGNVWNTIGVFSSGKAYVYADEAFFLMDSHGFEIADESNSNYSSPKINSFDDILSIIAKDCGLSSYKVTITTCNNFIFNIFCSSLKLLKNMVIFY